MRSGPEEFLIHEASISYQRTLQTGSTIQVPALLYGGKTIWGLTYRMLRDFLELITEP